MWQRLWQRIQHDASCAWARQIGQKYSLTCWLCCFMYLSHCQEIGPIFLHLSELGTAGSRSRSKRNVHSSHGKCSRRLEAVFKCTNFTVECPTEVSTQSMAAWPTTSICEKLQVLLFCFRFEAFTNSAKLFIDAGFTCVAASGLFHKTQRRIPSACSERHLSRGRNFKTHFKPIFKQNFENFGF